MEHDHTESYINTCTNLCKRLLINFTKTTCISDNIFLLTFNHKVIRVSMLSSQWIHTTQTDRSMFITIYYNGKMNIKPWQYYTQSTWNDDIQWVKHQQPILLNVCGRDRLTTISYTLQLTDAASVWYICDTSVIHLWHICDTSVT